MYHIFLFHFHFTFSKMQGVHTQVTRTLNDFTPSHRFSNGGHMTGLTGHQKNKGQEAKTITRCLEPKDFNIGYISKMCMYGPRLKLGLKVWLVPVQRGHDGLKSWSTVTVLYLDWHGKFYYVQKICRLLLKLNLDIILLKNSLQISVAVLLPSIHV